MEINKHYESGIFVLGGFFVDNYITGLVILSKDFGFTLGQEGIIRRV